MTVDEALEWAAKRCSKEAVLRMRSRAAVKALANEVLNLRADRARETPKVLDRLVEISADNRALREENDALRRRLDKFKGLDDSLEIEADRAYNMLKDSGRLQHLEEHRALVEQLKWGE